MDLSSIKLHTMTSFFVMTIILLNLVSSSAVHFLPLNSVDACTQEVRGGTLQEMASDTNSFDLILMIANNNRRYIITSIYIAHIF